MPRNRAEGRVGDFEVGKVESREVLQLRRHGPDARVSDARAALQVERGERRVLPRDGRKAGVGEQRAPGQAEFVHPAEPAGARRLAQRGVTDTGGRPAQAQPRRDHSPHDVPEPSAHPRQHEHERPAAGELKDAFQHLGRQAADIEPVRQEHGGRGAVPVGAGNLERRPPGCVGLVGVGALHSHEGADRRRVAAFRRRCEWRVAVAPPVVRVRAGGQEVRH